MLTNIQFLTLLNNITMLPACRSVGVKLENWKRLPQNGEYQAALSVGAGNSSNWLMKTRQPPENLGQSRFQLYLYVNNRKMTLNADLASLQLTHDSVQMLEYLLSVTPYLVSNVLYYILNTGYILGDTRSAEYNRIYPEAPFPDQVSCIINGNEEVSMAQTEGNPLLNKPVDKVGRLTIDMVINGSVDAERVKRTWLYHIIIEHGIFAISRYLNTGDTPKLSHKVSRIDLKSAMTEDSEDENSLFNQLHKLIDDWSIVETDRIVVDKFSGVQSKSSSSTGQTIYLASTARCLEFAPEKILYVPAQDMAKKAEGLSRLPRIALGIDDYLDCYPIANGAVHVRVNRSAEKRICISYTVRGMGTVVSLYVDADVNNVADGAYVVKGDSLKTAMLKYTNGRGGVETLERIHVVEGFRLAREIVTLSVFAVDIYSSVYYWTSDVYKTQKLPIDDLNMSISYFFEVQPTFHCVSNLEVTTKTSINTIKLEGVFMSGSTLGLKFDGSTAKPVSDRVSIYEQSIKYNPKQKASSTGELLAAYAIQNCTRAATDAQEHDIQGRLIQNAEVTQSKVDKATRFKSASELGSALLDVRDALVYTFGEGVIGVPPHHSKLSRSCDIHPYYASIAVNENGKHVPVLASFGLIGGGNFSAMRDDDGKPIVRCKFDQAWEVVDLVPDHTDERGRTVYRLSDKFLKWYLQDMDVDNGVRNAIYRAVTEPHETDPDTGDLLHVPYKLNPHVVDIVMAGYNQDGRVEKPFDNVPNEHFKNSPESQLDMKAYKVMKDDAGQEYLAHVNEDGVTDQEDLVDISDDANEVSDDELVD